MAWDKDFQTPLSTEMLDTIYEYTHKCSLNVAIQENGYKIATIGGIGPLLGFTNFSPLSLTHVGGVASRKGLCSTYGGIANAFNPSGEKSVQLFHMSLQIPWTTPPHNFYYITPFYPKKK